MTMIRLPKDDFADREFLTVDPYLATAAGAWKNVTKVNKFGYAPDGVQATATDIWDRADAAPTQQIWIAPGFTPGSSTAVTHFIKSTSAVDTGPSGTGARTVRVSGLTSWDAPEVLEDIVMNGTTNVETTNAYVIIHRMSVVEYGAISGPNVGIITATENFPAANVIAQINATWGQTEMAIYGIPSTQTAYLVNWYASIQKSSGADADVNFKLMYSQDPAVSASKFVTKEIRGLQSTGSSNGHWGHNPYKSFTGPGILKIQAIGSSADIDCTAGFDLILLDN